MATAVPMYKGHFQEGEHEALNVMILPSDEHTASEQGEAVGDDDWDDPDDGSLEILEEAMDGLTAERASSWIDFQEIQRPQKTKPLSGKARSSKIDII
ncbi:hypothetical protein N7493_004089 [Penicillium malachiteum]|uniref:Uncharacterized protein n=1 Tax=Penicillium malachiteum TaxID=1324776 RepID=A0AAD6HRX1_9EURO|nr:hypothetical protein N7493_004089 [Penicillium malachiteum]